MTSFPSAALAFKRGTGLSFDSEVEEDNPDCVMTRRADYLPEQEFFIRRFSKNDILVRNPSHEEWDSVNLVHATADIFRPQGLYRLWWPTILILLQIELDLAVEFCHLCLMVYQAAPYLRPFSGLQSRRNTCPLSGVSEPPFDWGTTWFTCASLPGGVTPF